MELLESIKTGFIDKTIESNREFRPSLVTNNQNSHTKILMEIISSMHQCNSFVFSVAFVSESGLAAIKQSLLELKEYNQRGTIITSTYLGFNNPKVFQELLKLENVDVYIYEGEGFHPKGYIFKYDDYQKIMIGSHNLTQTALSNNYEWTIMFHSYNEGEVAQQIEKDIDYQLSLCTPLTQEWIDSYKEVYKPVERYTPIVKKKLEPNYMQKAALSSLTQLRVDGKDKALLISATGTGKTYLSAFDVRQFNAKKALFVVHRENIAQAAMRSFQNVIPDKKMGMFTGNSKELDCDYLFATVQTIGKYEYYSSFPKDYFDYIILDEVHRAGASQHQNIINYFEPQFLLGMSATPERSDKFDIYELFDHNIAYEIRLKDAMEFKLLTPFHYYGISDLIVDGVEIDDKTQTTCLASNQRVQHVIDAINKYGYCGDKVHGLIFCSRKQEAKELSDKFNTLGYNTVALTGDDPESYRQQMIEKLESNDEDGLDYIFTVDIFNEGIDIPCVNQIVMLRPTESSIIFVQQLGRGLRKYKLKDYVVVIDFIGNYEKNFMIPIALSGSCAYNKDELRKMITTGNAVIPGPSTIHFDLISKKKIYESIDNAQFSNVDLIKSSYKNLKQKLGYIPRLIDFDIYNSIDPVRIFDNKTLKTYHKFLSKYEKEYKIKFNDKQEKYLEYICEKFASGKREKELLTLQKIIEKQTISDLRSEIPEYTGLTYESIVSLLSGQFITGSAKKTYKDTVFIISKDGKEYVNPQFIECLQDECFVDAINEVIEFGLHRYHERYANKYQDTDFVLYEKYTYEDVCRLLNWQKGEVPLNIGGYKFDKHTNTFPVFINYEKKEVQHTINYEDRFINPSSLVAISKSKRTIESDDIQTIYHSKERNVHMHLFVRKNKDDKASKEFYYLGNITPYGKPKEFIMPNTTVSAVELNYQLDTPVRKDVYDYIIE